MKRFIAWFIFAILVIIAAIVAMPVGARIALIIGNTIYAFLILLFTGKLQSGVFPERDEIKMK